MKVEVLRKLCKEKQANKVNNDLEECQFGRIRHTIGRSGSVLSIELKSVLLQEQRKHS